MDEETKLRIANELYRVLYKNTGIMHRGVIRIMTALLRGVINKREALALCNCYFGDEGATTFVKAKSKIDNEWICPESYLFLKKYGDCFDAWDEEHVSCGELKNYETEFANVIEHCQYEPKIKATVKDIKWVQKRVTRDMYTDYGSKRKLYDADNASKAGYLRYNFFLATRYTEENHRKQSQRYTVSRDEDKKRFYRSAKGRLACLPVYKLKKYMKQGKIVEDHHELSAKEDITDGIYIKIGSYIEKHFPKIPKPNKEALQRAFEEIRPCKMIIDRDFKKAYDPYYNCHQDTDGDKASNYSCMSGQGNNAQEFYGGIHGCKVVRFETDKGDQVGRCIMYEFEGRRHFIRIYGLYDYHRTMINLLQNEMKEGDLFGRNERIEGMKLETDWCDETQTMYLDGNCYGITKYTDENGEHKWRVGVSYDYDCKTTEHESLEYLDDDDYCTCDHCGERVYSDEGYWIDDHFYCCTDCAHEEGYYYCEYCDEWGHEDDGVWIDGDFYCCDECAEAAGYRRCLNCGEWKDKDDMIECGGEWFCCEDCANNEGWFRCLHCGDWQHSDNSETVITEDGEYCCDECAEKDGWVKVGEEWKREEDVEEVKEQEPEEPKEVVNEG